MDSPEEIPPLPSEDELVRLLRSAYRQAQRERDPEKWKEQRQREGKRHRLKAFGVTEDLFDALVRQQKGKCRICKRRRKLVADHDHATGLFRGVICGKCNSALGMADDDPAVLRRMARYLEDKL